MKYIKEYLGFEEDNNVKTLIDILEDTELNFQYRVCQVDTIGNTQCIYNSANTNVIADDIPSLYYSCEKTKEQFELIRIHFDLESNKESLDPLLKNILSTVNLTMIHGQLSRLEFNNVRNIPIIQRIQNLSNMTLINIDHVESFWPINYDYNPSGPWNELNEFLILDFTHSENILN